jgi:hypothetical protein
VSLTGTDNLLVQLGDAGGIETTDYTSSSAVLQSSTAVAVDIATAGLVVRLAAASLDYIGILTLELIDPATNLWVSSHNGKLTGQRAIEGGGRKALSGALTQLRVTTTGSDTFDAGMINFSYEVG